MIKSAARAIRDSETRSRVLWFTLGVAVSLVFVGIGGGYAFAGQGATLVPTAFRVILLGGHLPGGYHTHGCIMVTLGFIELWGIARISQHYTKFNWSLVQYSSYAIIGYAIWVAAAFAGSSVLTGQYNAGSWYYLFIAAVTTAKCLLPPAFKK